MSATNPLHDQVTKFVLLTLLSPFHVNVRGQFQNHESAGAARESAMRYPTLLRSMDSLIATYFAPYHGRHQRLGHGPLVEIVSLVRSRLQKNDRRWVGLSKGEEAVLLGVGRENQHLLKRKIVRCLEGCRLQWQKERRMIFSTTHLVEGCSCKRCHETTMVE